MKLALKRSELLCSDFFRESSHTSSETHCKDSEFIAGRNHRVRRTAMQVPFEAAREPIQFPATPLIRDELPYRLRHEPDQKRLVVRAGVGWAPDTIDIVSVAADLGSPAGYAYQTGESVISNHLEAETRFRTPQLLADHGVRRAVNGLIEKGGEGKAYFGVLEVDSADPGQFGRGLSRRLRRPARHRNRASAGRRQTPGGAGAPGVADAGDESPRQE
jgi:hypothetical protein